MNATNHTPGPWRILRTDHQAQLHPNCLLIVNQQKDIAQVYQDPDMDADARLIAAAPELADVLREIAEDCAYYGDAAALQARAVLAKAGL